MPIDDGLKPDKYTLMSVAELQRTIAKLPADQQRTVAKFVSRLAKRNTPAHRRQLSVLMKEMDAGKKYTRAQVEAILARNPPGRE
jgi:uncharacterized small protein (DUF1192 family)